ncbi:NAD(P)-binding protein [Paenibacillus sp. YYML68]|uniref:NAD(P)-binding protein n=1 Tax=Paenibacillus sp. YYML68 TaxID=2909250 RepID=UPI002492CBC0|nr:NAD(P)-binding protein [Paenibacillus sp. YYML68]
MNVAIMGAGLSGLACALTLERSGVMPVVYEKRGRVGDRFVNGEFMLSLLSRPIDDCIAYLAETHKLYLQPQAHVSHMYIYSENEEALIEGRLGFTNVRGRQHDAYECQLARQLASPIRLHAEETYEQLLQKHTHIVLATGDGDYSRRMHNFRRDFTVSIKGATVEGCFDRYAVMAWLNYELAPKGYGYLIPFSDREAQLVIAFPDPEEPHAGGEDIEALWQRLYAKAQQRLGQQLRVIDQFQIRQYPVGICESARIGNTFFVGNCFGTMMPYLGFGQFAAILSGIYAAHDLLGIGKYVELMEPLRQSYENSLVLRRSLEQLDNADLDRIVKLLSGPWGSRLFQPGTFDPLKLASYVLRPYVKLKTGIMS